MFQIMIIRSVIVKTHDIAVNEGGPRRRLAARSECSCVQKGEMTQYWKLDLGELAAKGSRKANQSRPHQQQAARFRNRRQRGHRWRRIGRRDRKSVV